VSRLAAAATTARVAIGVSGPKGASGASGSKGAAGTKRADASIRKLRVPTIGVMAKLS
jgi:hypothetical protein